MNLKRYIQDNTTNGSYAMSLESNEVTCYAPTYFTLYQKLLMKLGIHQTPKGGKITKGKFVWDNKDHFKAIFYPNP